MAPFFRCVVVIVAPQSSFWVLNDLLEKDPLACGNSLRRQVCFEKNGGKDSSSIVTVSTSASKLRAAVVVAMHVTLAKPPEQSHVRLPPSE